MIFGRKARTATEAKREQVEAFEDEPTTDDDASDSEDAIVPRADGPFDY